MMPNNRQPNAHTHNVLNVTYWNAAGLLNKIVELESFMLNQSIDIMMIIEARVDTVNSINIDGYICYLVPNPESTRKGGVATYVKQNIRHSALETISTPMVQCAPIALFPSNGNANPITITPIYCPPIYQWTSDHFNRLFIKIGSLSQGSRLLICGDWNAKHTWWGNVRSCLRGRSLFTAINRREHLNILATGGATHFPYARRNRPSAIDFAIYAGIRNEALRTYSSIDLDSDHLPIHINLELGAIPRSSTNSQLLQWNSNIQTFQRHLERNIDLDLEINTCTSIDEAITKLNNDICIAAAAATPANTSSRTALGPSRIQLSDTSRRLLLLKRQQKLINLTQHTLASQQLYRKTQNQLKKSLIKDKAKQLNIILETVDTADRYRLQKLWQFTNKVKRQPEPNWPLKTQPNANVPPCWTKTSQDKTETFANHLEQRFSPILLNQDTDRRAISSELETNKHRLQLYTNSQVPRIITSSEILQIIDALPPKKSPGWDLINNKVLKSLPPKAIDLLALIFNSVLKLGHFPQQWKLAMVSMVLKPGKCVNSVASYRPISLLCSFSKLFERLLMDRLFEVEEFELAIPCHQFGFRKEHGTDQQLFRVSQFILKGFEASKFCSAVYIDISEAFDRVWHVGLLLKLSKLLPLCLFKVLESYLDGRSFLIKGPNGTKSSVRRILAGVPQGSVLGPILYTVYSSDMPLPIQRYGHDHMLSTFADDTVILASSTSLQQSIRANQTYLIQLEKWAATWCIKINSAKTAHVIHTTRVLSSSDRSITIQLCGCDVPISSRHKYLGLHLDSKLNLKFHITFLRTRTMAIAEKFRWLLGSHCKLTRECKALLYKQLIAPVWHYAIPIWGALASDTQFKRIDRLQNKILRKATSSVWYTSNQALRDRYNISSADEVFTSSSARLFSSLANHPNQEARLLILAPYRPQRLHRARYSTQLATQITPLQSTIPQPQPQSHVPILIRMSLEEQSRRPPLSWTQLARQQEQQAQRQQTAQQRVPSPSIEQRRLRLHEMILQIIHGARPNERRREPNTQQQRQAQHDPEHQNQ
jgi:hypothetical protein